jgi:hypothetical protein
VYHLQKNFRRKNEETTSLVPGRLSWLQQDGRRGNAARGRRTPYLHGYNRVARRQQELHFLSRRQKIARQQLDLTLKFSAKNEQGMASNLIARCVVSADGKKLVNIDVREGH